MTETNVTATPEKLPERKPLLRVGEMTDSELRAGKGNDMLPADYRQQCEDELAGRKAARNPPPPAPAFK
jgi:hypothetical protein